MPIRIDLDAEQQRILHPPPGVKFIDWKAGRRRGKSITARALLVEGAVCLGQSCLYATPEASQFQAMYDFFKHTPALKTRQADYGCKIQPVPHLTFRSGGYLEFRSLENIEAARGGEFKKVLVDETQSLRCRMKDFDSVFRPMLLNQRGQLWSFGQFRGKNEHYQSYHLPGLPGPAYNPRHFSLVSPTSSSPYFQTAVGAADLEEERKTILEHIWRQEYLCECLDSAAAVFGKVERAIIPNDSSEIKVELAASGTPHVKPKPGCVYLAFMDSGKVEDPGALVVIEKKSGIVCYAAAYDIGLDYTMAIDHMAAICRYYGNYAAGIDITSAGTQSSALLDLARKSIRNVNGIVFGESNKHDMITQTGIEIELARVLIPECFAELIQQIRRYEYDRHPISNKYIYRAPIGEHDDLVMAFIGALHMRRQNWGPNIGGQSLGTMAG